LEGKAFGELKKPCQPLVIPKIPRGKIPQKRKGIRNLTRQKRVFAKPKPFLSPPFFWGLKVPNKKESFAKVSKSLRNQPWAKRNQGRVP